MGISEIKHAVTHNETEKKETKKNKTSDSVCGTNSKKQIMKDNLRIQRLLRNAMQEESDPPKRKTTTV